MKEIVLRLVLRKKQRSNALNHRIKFIRTQNPHSPIFQRMWKLYLESFPSHERRSYEAQLEALKDPHLFCMKILYGWKFSGFVWFWKHADFYYIEHMAMCPQMRSKGLGSRVLSLLQQRKKRIILESEPPTNETRKRRIGFYKRNGFHANAVHYEHPGYGVQTNIHSMVLMTSPTPWQEDSLQSFQTFLDNCVMQYVDTGR